MGAKKGIYCHYVLARKHVTRYDPCKYWKEYTAGGIANG